MRHLIVNPVTLMGLSHDRGRGTGVQ